MQVVGRMGLKAYKTKDILGAAALRVERAPLWLSVFVPLSLLFLLTARYHLPYHIDALTNAITGWHLGMRGTVIVQGYEEIIEEPGYLAFFTRSPRGPVAFYPPGAPLLSAPFYWIWHEPSTVMTMGGGAKPEKAPVRIPIPPFAPAAFTAAFSSAAAVLFFALALAVLGATRRSAIAAAYIAGLGTSIWSVTSVQLWQHGPAAMFISLGLYFIARDRLFWGGLAIGGAVLTRPHTALIAAAIGVGLACSGKTIRPIVEVGIGASLGLAALLLFNWWVWGFITVAGGYENCFDERLFSWDLVWYLRNIVDAFFDFKHGLFIYSPFLVVLLLGIVQAGRRGPDWAVYAAGGGALYLLLQLKAENFSGGEGHNGYRYPIETLVAAAPILFVAYHSFVQRSSFGRKAFWGLSAFSIAVQALFVTVR